MAEGSKAKFIREALDRALELKVPQVSPEDFERAFSIRATPEEIKTLTLAELMVRQLVLKACAGSDRSITEVLDRLLGKPTQTTESVSKSYSYHDLLIELKKQDDAAAVTYTVPQQKQVTHASVKAAVDDILADLI